MFGESSAASFLADEGRCRRGCLALRGRRGVGGDLVVEGGYGLRVIGPGVEDLAGPEDVVDDDEAAVGEEG